MAHPPISTPKGPSALELTGLNCQALSPDEILDLPVEFARTAALAKTCGFGGVQIHAAQGFLPSQFLSPLFNHRSDGYGGALDIRMRLLREVIDAVRDAVDPTFPVALKLNSSDQLIGGFEENESLEVIAELDQTSIDLVEFSGGTCFPGAKSASDSPGGGPSFLKFAERARLRTDKPLMLTGGFKSRAQADEALSRGIDVIGLARALALEPDLPGRWKADTSDDPVFPRFASAPEGGITAWYTPRLTAIAGNRESRETEDLETAISDYEARDLARVSLWRERFPI